MVNMDKAHPAWLKRDGELAEEHSARVFELEYSLAKEEGSLARGWHHLRMMSAFQRATGILDRETYFDFLDSTLEAEGPSDGTYREDYEFLRILLLALAKILRDEGAMSW